ncbi:MAG: DUF2971 domain-containing protein [Candidatus Hydrogenedentes bacterium]|nr:DUF2971 domain-containing protein [Candidatus Hydrogenedentota bacterium]
MSTEKTMADAFTELWLEIRDICVETQIEGPHTGQGSLLYHYTNAAGLIGILTRRCIWATNLSYVNDPQELTHGHHYCVEVLKSLSTSPAFVMPYVFETAIQQLDTGRKAIQDQMAACLSTESDLLSQWRAYSDSGKGFSIGFDAERILQILVHRRLKSGMDTIPIFTPLRLIYEDDKKFSLLTRIAECVNRHRETLQAGRPTAAPAIEVETVLGHYLALGYWFASMSFKKNGFQEEAEVRLVVSNLIELDGAKVKIPVKARVGRNGDLVTYYEIGLGEKDDELPPVKRIYVGPAMDFEREKSGLLAFLHTLGYVDATMPEILPSRTTLTPY